MRAVAASTPPPGLAAGTWTRGPRARRVVRRPSYPRRQVAPVRTPQGSLALNKPRPRLSLQSIQKPQDITDIKASKESKDISLTDHALSDDSLALAFIKNSGAFTHVHPNAITLAGYLATAWVWWEGTRSTFHVPRGLLALFARWACDCLDGNVARYYQKTSELGGTLDTVGDWLFHAALMASVVCRLGASAWWVAVWVVAMVCVSVGYGATADHRQYKYLNPETSSWAHKVVVFINTFSWVVHVLVAVVWTVWSGFEAPAR